MNKKLQVFISSTFTDLQDERQAAVEAVLKAGHIPAGMELFKSADESQKETITKWIRESDVYLLILGGRYGSIEPHSEKSYTHWEYDYAGEIGIPRFSIVIKESTLDEKVKKIGQSVLERENYGKYQEFRSIVLSKTSHFFEDIKDIKITIMQALNDLSKDTRLYGWISGKEVESVDDLQKKFINFVDENRLLKKEIERLKQLLRSKEKEREIVDKTTVKLNKDVDFSEKVDQILSLLGAVEMPRSIGSLSWDVISEDNENEEKSVSLPFPPREFNAYFIYSPDGNSILKLLIVAVANDENFDIQVTIGNIRILLNEYREAEGVPVNFVIAIPGNHGELQDRASEFLTKALSKVAVIDKKLFDIQIWDDNVVKHFEDELGLYINF
jgi:hypothetical protein